MASTWPLAQRTRPRHRRLPHEGRQLPRHHAAARRWQGVRPGGRRARRPVCRCRRPTVCWASRPAASSSPLRSPTAWAPDSSRCARPASCRGRSSARSTRSSTARDKLEIHRDAIHPGERILVIDDVLATGGTAAATVPLVEALGGVVVGRRRPDRARRPRRPGPPRRAPRREPG